MRPFSTITQLLAAQASERPAAPAVLAIDGSGLTFRELDALTVSHASVLAAMGIGRNDRVAMLLPNGMEAATAFLAVSRVATAAPLNPRLTESEIAFYLEDLEARAVAVASDDATAASAAAASLGIPTLVLNAVREEAVRPRSPDAEPRDVALVLHTSGTTGRPKIVPLTHGNLCQSAANVASTLQLTHEDRCLNIMPLFHIHGLVAALLASLQSGASVVCTPGFRAPHFFEWLRAVHPSWYTAVPTMHQGILGRAGEEERAWVRGSRLRLVRSSSASLPPSVLREVEEAFGVPVIEAYGMTEAAHQMASNPLPPRVRKPGSVGPAAGPEVAIASPTGDLLAQGEVGEVVIRGPNVTEGYHGLNDQGGYFFGEGWFRTGDQGYLDVDGYLFLTGRLKEIINRGGETIAPREIDEALLELPQVKQAVAFSVPDSKLGEEVAAAVILMEGAAATESQLQMALAGRLSWPRIPKRILFLDEIPKGPTGKLQRIGLAEKLGLASVEKEGRDDAVAPPGDTGVGRIPPGDLLARVADLWREVLNLESVDPDQPFLDAGGDSVTATILVLRVEAEFGVEVPLMTFFDAATVRRQAAVIQALLV